MRNSMHKERSWMRVQKQGGGDRLKGDAFGRRINSEKGERRCQATSNLGRGDRVKRRS